MTIDDPAHSQCEARFVTVGEAIARKVVVVIHTDRGSSIRIISAGVPRAARGVLMSQGDRPQEPEMHREYDFRGGERGRYAGRYAEGSNVVVLSPDVAESFPDSEFVNEALRGLIEIARRSSTR